MAMRLNDFQQEVIKEEILKIRNENEVLKAENERLRAELAEARSALAIADEMANSHTNIEKAAS